MNLERIQSWMVTYLLPAILFFVGTVGIVVIFGKAYFWDISTLTIRFTSEVPLEVTLKTRVRLIHHDFSFFGFRYRLHLTLPRTYVQKCLWECIFKNISPGETQIIISGSPPRFARVFVAPDTQGVIDLRPPIILWTERSNPVTLPEKNSTIMPPFFSNTTQGLFLFRNNSFYDHLLRQTIVFPPRYDCQRIFLWIKNNEYYCVTDAEILLIDRYGKNDALVISNIHHENMGFSWSEGRTMFSLGEKAVTLPGYWFPWLRDGKYSMTDGEQIFSWEE